MSRFTVFLLLALCLLLALPAGYAQSRLVVDVPKVDPGTITIDGVANEAAWATAAKADVITNIGFQGWFNYYGRDVIEPDYQELWGRMLWSMDTLYVYIHIKDIVNDSTGLYWDPSSHWAGDQLFVAISNRLGIPMGGNYDGNVYAAPEGPYHFLILGNRVTLNNGDTTNIPPEWRKDTSVTRASFDAATICRSATVVDTLTGEWDVEMAIYNPAVAAGTRIGFNFGGSQASRAATIASGDAYAYWCWEPSVDNDPFAVPPLGPGAPGDPGGFNLINSDYWPILHFVPGGSDIVRHAVSVPRVDPSKITIDGHANEPEWSGAAKADVITNIGFQGWFNYYGRDVIEPDYQELWGRMLWAMDTLYVHIHIKDIVNDSTGLYWDPSSHWAGDQLFVAISNRLGIPMGGNYDGNIYAAPEGPYHFLILGNRVTLNNGDTTNIPPQWRTDTAVTRASFDAAKICRSATVVDTLTGEWDVEMAIYNPAVAAGTRIGFNFGGSQGSRAATIASGDAYAYWCWEPSVDNDPFAVPPLGPGAPGDPGGFNLINSDYWPILHFVPGGSDIVRHAVSVPRVDPSKITIDGRANEPEWSGAAKADVITNIGFQGWFNYYGRDVIEPDYQELWGRMLWAMDTLYVHIHIKDIVNDSTGLYWDPSSHWAGDQLFVDISNRLGIPMGGNYDGNVYAAPEGPYHFLILGNRVTLNNGDTTNIPPQWRTDTAVTRASFDAAKICRSATVVDTLTGEWDVEMAIYNPGVAGQANLGFNFGGSQGSRAATIASGDAYAYWCWEPSVDNDPFAVPPLGSGAPGDPGGFNLINSDYWPLLGLDTTMVVTGVKNGGSVHVPATYVLDQNYPNPFNPSTRISYSLPKATSVKLVVFNVLGQIVATLVDEHQAAGQHDLTWNAARMSSGVYFLQLKADGKSVLSRKMMLLK